MSIIIVDMLNEFKNIGLSEKESKVYLALLEMGLQPASTIAKIVKIPKSTTLFILENLNKEGLIRKCLKGKTQYFYADPKDFQSALEEKLKKQHDSLNTLLPFLEKTHRPFSSRPQITFYEGVDNCKKAYQLLLDANSTVLEFGSHTDLENAFGKTFMQKFIQKRVANKIHLKALTSQSKAHFELIKDNQKQLREHIVLDNELGIINSSIALFDNKILILNLKKSAFGILIDNPDMYETLKTLFYLGFESQKK